MLVRLVAASFHRLAALVESRFLVDLVRVAMKIFDVSCDLRSPGVGPRAGANAVARVHRASTLRRKICPPSAPAGSLHASSCLDVSGVLGELAARRGPLRAPRSIPVGTKTCQDLASRLRNDAPSSSDGYEVGQRVLRSWLPIEHLWTLWKHDNVSASQGAVGKKLGDRVCHLARSFRLDRDFRRIGTDHLWTAADRPGRMLW